jgi:hypothetical protein
VYTSGISSPTTGVVEAASQARAQDKASRSTGKTDRVRVAGARRIEIARFVTAKAVPQIVDAGHFSVSQKLTV